MAEYDFSVKLENSDLAPYFKAGDTIFAKRKEPLLPGDVGIFYYDGKMIVRQYCEDSFGGIYLFSVNRRKKNNDIYVPHTSKKNVCCFGKVILSESIPLPKE
jgi:SOS-response transcriptional repressor LexA